MHILTNKSTKRFTLQTGEQSENQIKKESDKQTDIQQTNQLTTQLIDKLLYTKPVQSKFYQQTLLLTNQQTIHPIN
jgi:hypothetical protein